MGKGLFSVCLGRASGAAVRKITASGAASSVSVMVVRSHLLDVKTQATKTQQGILPYDFRCHCKSELEKKKCSHMTGEDMVMVRKGMPSQR